MHELPRMVADQPVGKEVEVILLRKGEQQSLNVVLGRLEEAEAQMAALADPEEDPVPEPEMLTGPLGLTLSDLSPTTRERFDIGEEVSGVLVTEVEMGSAADEKRVQAGDVIVEISQEPVETPTDVEARVEQLKEEGRKTALLLLSNGSGDLRFIAVTIE